MAERAHSRPRSVAFPEATEVRTGRAVRRLARSACVRPVVVGPRGRLEALFGGVAGVELHPVEAGQDALDTAADLLARGRVDGAVAGAVRPTAEVLRAALKRVGRGPGFTTVSSAFYLALRRPTPGGVGVLTFTDPGVVPRPTAAQLAESAAAACAARRAIVGDEPRVAFLSYSTHGSAEGESVETMRRALTLFRQRLPDIPADGELQADAALVPEVARRKAPEGEVRGDANVLVFPDLDAANIAYKLVERLAGARALGPVLQGLARPFNDLSRGAGAREIFHVACLTALMADGNERE